MGLANLPPAVLRSGSGLINVSPARTGSLIQRAPRAVVPATRTPITVEGIARTVKAVPPKSPFYKSKVFIGGSAISVATLSGMGINELADVLASADPAEIQSLVTEADNAGFTDMADELSNFYNETLVVSRDDITPSNADKDMIILDAIERTGLGLDRDEVDRQQALSRAYRSIRASFTLEDIFALRLFVTTASDSDLVALEDMYRG